MAAKAKSTKTVKPAEASKVSKASKPCACKDTPVAPVAKKVDIEKAKDKVASVAKKIPQWLARAKKELDQLIEKLNKLDAYLSKILEAFGGQVTWANARRVKGKDDRSVVNLLMKQRQAMVAYRDALQARIEIAEKGIALSVKA